MMRNGRDRRSENPFWATAKKERVLLVGTDQRITSGPAAKRLRSKAGYMAAPERFADSQIPLAPRAPSIHGPSPGDRPKSPVTGVELPDEDRQIGFDREVAGSCPRHHGRKWRHSTMNGRPKAKKASDLTFTGQLFPNAASTKSVTEPRRRLQRGLRDVLRWHKSREITIPSPL
jgi:hypothetical protein